MVKLGVRWKTVTWAARSAMTGMIWMPEEPVPITATRLPVKSTSSCGQRPVWKLSPRKEPAPGMPGTRASDRQPTAVMRKRAVTRSPRSVSTRQRDAASS